MDLEKIKNLIERESNKIEFKLTTGQLERAAETLCAFLNEKGGSVLVGVQDNGTLIGQDVSDRTQQDIAHVLNKFEPFSHIEVHYVDLFSKIKNSKKVIVLTAHPDAHSVPYSYKSRPYSRKESSTIVMPQSRYQELLVNRMINPPCWERRESFNINFNDLDHDEIINTINSGIQKGRILPAAATKDPKMALKRLNLTINDKITNAAVVLYANPSLFYPQCTLKLALFKSEKKRDIIDSKQISGHAFHLIEQAEQFFSRHISIRSRFVSGQMERVDEPDYPPLAVREAIVNAVCHKDYTISGGSISLLMYEDRLEVISHGRLPNGVNIESLKQVHSSQPRNHLIAKVLYLSGMIEEMGMGTQEMIVQCEKLKIPEPEFLELENTFVVRFKKKEMIAKREKSDIFDLTERQAEILSILRKNEKLSRKKISSFLAASVPNRTLQYDLLQLKKQGHLISEGRGVNVVWSILKK